MEIPSHTWRDPHPVLLLSLSWLSLALLLLLPTLESPSLPLPFLLCFISPSSLLNSLLFLFLRFWASSLFLFHVFFFSFSHPTPRILLSHLLFSSSSPVILFSPAASKEKGWIFDQADSVQIGCFSLRDEALNIHNFGFCFCTCFLFWLELERKQFYCLSNRFWR